MGYPSPNSDLLLPHLPGGIREPDAIVACRPMRRTPNQTGPLSRYGHHAGVRTTMPSWAVRLFRRAPRRRGAGSSYACSLGRTLQRVLDGSVPPISNAIHRPGTRMRCGLASSAGQPCCGARQGEERTWARSALSPDLSRARADVVPRQPGGVTREIERAVYLTDIAR